MLFGEVVVYTAGTGCSRADYGDSGRAENF